MTEVRCGCGTPAVIPAAGRSLIYWRERNKWKTHCGALFCSSWRELFRRFIHLSLGKSIHQPPIRRFSFPAALTLQPIKASSVELKKRRLIEFKWSVNRFFFFFSNTWNEMVLINGSPVMEHVHTFIALDSPDKRMKTECTQPSNC